MHLDLRIGVKNILFMAYLPEFFYFYFILYFVYVQNGLVGNQNEAQKGVAIVKNL